MVRVSLMHHQRHGWLVPLFALIVYGKHISTCTLRSWLLYLFIYCICSLWMYVSSTVLQVAFWHVSFLLIFLILVFYDWNMKKKNYCIISSVLFCLLAKNLWFVNLNFYIPRQLVSWSLRSLILHSKF